MSKDTLAFSLSLGSLLLISGIAWRGGTILGHFQEAISGFKTAIQMLTDDMREQRQTLVEHGELLHSTARIVNGLERRVERLEAES